MSAGDEVICPFAKRNFPTAKIGDSESEVSNRNAGKEIEKRKAEFANRRTRYQPSTLRQWTIVFCQSTIANRQSSIPNALTLAGGAN